MGPQIHGSLENWPTGLLSSRLNRQWQYGTYWQHNPETLISPIAHRSWIDWSIQFNPTAKFIHRLRAQVGILDTTTIVGIRLWITRRKMLSKSRVLTFSATFASVRPRKKAPVVTFTARSYSQASSSGSAAKLLFRQLFEKESSTYTYVLADASHPDKPALVNTSCFGLV